MTARPTKKQSQADRIHALLLEGPVCGTTLLRMFIPRYAARVHELKEAGVKISTRRCENRNHSHESKQIEYYIEPPPTTETGRLF